MESFRPATGPDLGALKIDKSARPEQGGGNRWRWILAVFVLALVIAGAVFAFRSRVPQVEVVAVHAPTSSRQVLLNASGYVTPRRRATVAAKITGRVTMINAEEGMQVHEGQVLATLDDSDYRVRLTSATADRDATAAALSDLQVQLTNAERELHRTRTLQQQGVSSQQALDAAQTLADSLKAKITLTREQVRAAEERIRVAQQDLDNTVVRAPFSGIVVSKDAQIGEMVSPVSAGGGFTRTGIATIVDMQSIEIEVDVNESNIARVVPDMPVTAILDAYPDWRIPAKVRTVIPTADRQKATVKVRIAFDKLDPRILPDMGVKVDFLGSESNKSQAASVKALVPQSAARKDNGTDVVFVFRNGRAERRAVRLGGKRGNDQEILAGLADGDQVIIGGLEGLRDGTEVEIKK